MRLPAGYAGKVAIIDLSEEKTELRSTEMFFRDYAINPRLWLGGDGVITKMFWKDFPKPVDPLGPRNELVIATGPWTGTVAPWGGHGILGCINPETGAYGSGALAGIFSAVLKCAGFDVVIVRGEARRPTCVFIDDDRVTFEDASHVWGKETAETLGTVRRELDEHYEGDIRVLTTSVAGEHLVPSALACADGIFCSGRTGAGAVMGAKKLKALAIRGTGEISIHNPKGLLDACRRVSDLYMSDPLINLWEKYGATTYPLTVRRPPADGKTVRRNALAADLPHLKNVACLNCPAGCYHWPQVREGGHAGLRHLGGQMASLFSALEHLRLNDLDAILRYEMACQELGLEPTAFGQAFSWAVDCFEHATLTERETDGLRLHFGDEALIWEVMRRAAHREGNLGNLLADGGARIGKGSKKITPGFWDMSYLVHDQDLRSVIWALHFLASPQGHDWPACHNVWESSFQPEGKDAYPNLVGKTGGEIYEIFVDRLDMPAGLKKRIFGDPLKVSSAWVSGAEGKALATIWTENVASLFNSLVTCRYAAAGHYLPVGIGPTQCAEILNQITGWDTDYEELMTIGERVFNARRLINYRFGGGDRTQSPWSDEGIREMAGQGLWRGKHVPWEKLLREYDDLRGWSDRGLPTKKKLEELGIDDLAGNLDI